MIIFAGFVGGDREFFNTCQAAVRSGNAMARGLAAPEREKIQSREGEVLSPPGDVNADDIDLSAGEFGKTGDHVQKMLESADVSRSGVVLPSVNVNEEQRTLCFMDNFESRFSLRIIQGRTLIPELDEGHFVASVCGSSYGLGRLSGGVGVVRSVGRARSQQDGQRECDKDRTRLAVIRIRVCFH